MKTNTIAFRLCVSFVMLFAAGFAQSATVNISANAFNSSGELAPSDLLAQDQTFADLDNILIVLYRFSDGTEGFTRMLKNGSESAEAIVETIDLGVIVFNSGFRLYGSGDTGSNPWTLENISNLNGGVLESITLDLQGDMTPWFDRSAPDPGTPNSGSGQDFILAAGGPAGVINVTYIMTHAGPFGDVQFPSFVVDPDDLVGDAFKILEIDLTGLEGGGLGIGESISFYQDTDPAVIPEPVSMMTLVLGLVGIFQRGARRRL